MQTRTVYMQLVNPEQLRGWLQVRRMSYSELASLVGCSKQFIGKLCTGEKRSCTPEVARKIELVLLPPRDQRKPWEMDLFVKKGVPVPPLPPRRAARLPVRKTDLQRFWDYVDRRGPNECWPWRGAKTTGGYAQFHLSSGTHTFAHRFSYQTHHGSIPERYTIDHVAERGCVRRDCVNPAHLEAVTHQENCRRAWAARSTRNDSKLPVDKTPILSDGAATLQT